MVETNGHGRPEEQEAADLIHRAVRDLRAFPWWTEADLTRLDEAAALVVVQADRARRGVGLLDALEEMDAATVLEGIACDADGPPTDLSVVAPWLRELAAAIRAALSLDLPNESTE